MTLVDWIGFAGVTILLLAFFFNLKGLIHSGGLMYLFLNIIGAGLACMASVLLKYWPFIILEGCWAIVSVFGLIGYFRRKGL